MNKQLLEKTIKRLEEKLLVDRDVMDAADIEDLQDNIDALKKMLPTERTEIFGCYCKPQDITFVMKASYIGNDLHTEECVGWYHGEPTDKDNETFSHGCLLAVYEWDD